MSANGSYWVRVDQSFGFAVQPVFVAAEPWMMEMKGAPTSRPEVVEDTLPEVTETAIYAVAPNPFNPKTEIRFALKESERVKITIYDLRGRRVNDLIDKVFFAGRHAVTWDGRDQSGRRVSSSVYFARLQAGDVTLSRRMLLVK